MLPVLAAQPFANHIEPLARALRRLISTEMDGDAIERRTVWVPDLATAPRQHANCGPGAVRRDRVKVGSTQ